MSTYKRKKYLWYNIYVKSFTLILYFQKTYRIDNDDNTSTEVEKTFWDEGQSLSFLLFLHFISIRKHKLIMNFKYSITKVKEKCIFCII